MNRRCANNSDDTVVTNKYTKEQPQMTVASIQGFKGYAISLLVWSVAVCIGLWGCLPFRGVSLADLLREDQDGGQVLNDVGKTTRAYTFLLP